MGQDSAEARLDVKAVDRLSDNVATVILFAREEVTLSGAMSVNPNHLVIGIIRAEPSVIAVRLQADWTVERLDAAVTSRDPTATKIEEHVGVPLSPEAGRVFRRAIVMADAFGDSHITPLHLLAALLEDESSALTQLLNQAGLRREEIVESLRPR